MSEKSAEKIIISLPVPTMAFYAICLYLLLQFCEICGSDEPY